ncbi:MAG: DUF1064 domain-containing protein [Candidatus Hydrogenedentes bacterium]|nr:DUF1064 domain-containing protein [Candidatus Hydrogenedentota bacterium]
MAQVRRYLTTRAAEQRAVPRRGRRNKFGARKVTIDGHTFASTAEGKRYEYLREMQQRGEIRCLRLQPRYLLQPAYVDSRGRQVRRIEYVADFEYIECATGRTVIEDVKGVETQVFLLKKKLFERVFPTLQIKVVKLRRHNTWD